MTRSSVSRFPVSALPRSRYLLKRRQHFRRVSLHLHARKSLCHRPPLVNDEGGARDAPMRLPHHRFLHPDSVAFGDFVSSVGQQRMRNLQVPLPLGVRIDGVRTHAQDCRTQLRIRRVVVTERGSLNRSARGKVPHIEPEDDEFAVEVPQADGPALLVRQSKIGRLVPFFKHRDLHNGLRLLGLLSLLGLLGLPTCLCYLQQLSSSSI